MVRDVGRRNADMAAARPLVRHPPLSSIQNTDYIVLTTAGLEHIALPAISKHLVTTVHRVLHPPALEQWSLPPPVPADLVFPGEAGIAKLHFALPTPSNREEWASQHAAIASLPCTQAVLAPLALASGIDLDNNGLQQIEDLARSLPDDVFNRAMHTWRHFRRHGEPSTCDNPRFRASCLRDGKQSFNAPEVGECVGAAIYLSRGVPVHLWDYELEVRDRLNSRPHVRECSHASLLPPLWLSARVKGKVSSRSHPFLIDSLPCADCLHRAAAAGAPRHQSMAWQQEVLQVAHGPGAAAAPASCRHAGAPARFHRLAHAAAGGHSAW